MSSLGMGQQPRIAWIVDRIDYDVAGFRYRCLIPAYEMQVAGIDSIFATIDNVAVNDADIFVFVKSFGDKQLAFAEKLYRAGHPYILDLCDNIFGSSYAPKRSFGDPANFAKMAGKAAAILVASDALLKIVQQHVTAGQLVAVLPDAAFSLRYHLELFGWFRAAKVSNGRIANEYCNPAAQATGAGPLWARMTSQLSELLLPSGTLRRRLRRLSHSSSLSPMSGAKVNKVIWFGKHGTTYGKAGMQSLMHVVPHLEKVAAQAPLELVVISNNRKKFTELFGTVSFATRYRPWSNETVFEELMTSDVFLMPNETDEFSACKSANRALLSLAMGVPVIASALDSLSPISEAIVIDDWSRGLQRYLFEAAEKQGDLERASRLIAADYAPNRIGLAWSRIVSSALSESTRERALQLVS